METSASSGKNPGKQLPDGGQNDRKNKKEALEPTVASYSCVVTSWRMKKRLFVGTLGLTPKRPVR